MDRFLQSGKRLNSKAACECSTSDSEKNAASKKKKQKTKRCKISDVWKYFKRSDDKNLAKCLKCEKEYKTSGNTSNLRDHLKRFHPNLNVNETHSSTVANTFLADDNVPSTSSSCRSSIGSIDAYIKSAVLYETNTQRKKLIDKTLAEMIALDVQPYSIVEDAGFIQYSKVLDCRYKLPSRAHLKNVLIMDLYNETSAKLVAILEEVSDIAITCDIWTSRANISFLTVTGHFIYEYSLKTASLSTRKLIDVTNHSAQNIANTMQEVLTSWGLLKKTVCIVTGNASSTKKACELLKIRNIPCFAHTLNLVVQDALTFDDDATKALVSKCKTIVRFCKKNTINKKKFKLAKENFAYSLLQETPTRWNSFYIMIERILTSHKEIAAVLLSTKNAPQPFNAEEIKVLQDMEKILALFQQVSEKVSGGKYVTSSLIIPLTYGLNRKILNVSSQLQTEVGKKMVTVLLESIVRRLSPYEKGMVTRMATILDPRFKQVGFQQNTNAEEAGICLENELAALMNKEILDTSNIKATPTNESSLFDFLEQASCSRGSTLSNALKTKRQYLERAIVPQDMDPLLWLKVNQMDFPSIKTLMLKYFCIPATSVESERVFSKEGQIVSDRRTRLKEENVNILLFLNQNLWINSTKSTEH